MEVQYHSDLPDRTYAGWHHITRQRTTHCQELLYKKNEDAVECRPIDFTEDFENTQWNISCILGKRLVQRNSYFIF